MKCGELFNNHYVTCSQSLLSPVVKSVNIWRSYSKNVELFSTHGVFYEYAATACIFTALEKSYNLHAAQP